MMRRFLTLLLLFVAAIPAVAQSGKVPARSNKLVNDYSHILSITEVHQLEQRLVAFNDSTSNQIVVIILPTLGTYDENDMAQRIGQTWGVGQQEFNNGVVILIKSKTREEDWGAVAISTGYGVEGALPDVFCKRIIDDHMLDALGNGDYYRALTNALDIIEPVLAGEYSYEKYRQDERREGFIALGVFLLFIMLVVVLVGIYVKKHPESWHDNGGKGGGIYFGGLGGGGSRHGGGFGGFSGGGGFGGFGGGSFGGGGASGRF